MYVFSVEYYQINHSCGIVDNRSSFITQCVANQLLKIFIFLYKNYFCLVTSTHYVKIRNKFSVKDVSLIEEKLSSGKSQAPV